MILSSATANPVLTATLQKYVLDQVGLVGRLIAPIFLTGQQSAKYYVFDKENLLNIPRNLNRAPGSHYERTMLKLSDDGYNCSNKGIEIPVDDEERAKYQSAFSADDAAMKRAKTIILMNHEMRVRDLVTGGGATSSSPTVKWDAYTNAASDPVADVDAAKEVVRLSSGMVANLMILPNKVYLKLKEHPKVIEKIKYSERAIVNGAILQEVFGIPIAIAGGIENTAAEGQTVTPDYLWQDSVIILHREDSGDLQAPNFARTFIWSSMTGSDGTSVETYREDKIQSDVHRCKQHSDEKIVGPELGYHLSDTLT